MHILGEAVGYYTLTEVIFGETHLIHFRPYNSYALFPDKHTWLGIFNAQYKIEIKAPSLIP